MAKYIFKVYNSVYQQDKMIRTDFDRNALVSNIVEKDTLDESLSQCKTTLALAYSEEFSPYTRFFIDICNENDTVLKHLNYVVERDAVEPIIISESDKFLHHLSLIESSATAQTVLLPNNSLTWQLKDTVLRYYGIVPQKTYNGDFNKKSTPTPSSAGKEYLMGTWAHSKFFYHADNALEGWVDGTNVNPSLAMPIICPEDAKVYNFTYTIPKMYLKKSISDAFREGVFLGYDVTYNNLWTSGDGQELSTVTYIKDKKNNSVIMTVYHSGASTLQPTVDGYMYDNYGPDIFKMQPYEDLGAYRRQFQGAIGIQAANMEYTSNINGHIVVNKIFNTRKIENYNTSNSRDSITIDLLGTIIGDDGAAYDIKDSGISFTTCPYIKVYKYSDNSFLDDFELMDFPSFPEYISMEKPTQGADYGYCPISKGRQWSLKYTYFASANTADVKETTLTKSSKPYNAYEMFNKLQISYLQIEDTGLSDATLFGLLPYQFDDKSAVLAKDTTLPEVNFSQKSLWDALIFLCSFMGAIPTCQAQADTPQFIVHLNLLGATTETEQESSNLMTIYNSRDMSECVTEIKNEYNNIINSTGVKTEYLHGCSPDESSFVSVDNMVFLTEERIDRVISFGIIDPALPEGQQYADATDLFFNLVNYNQLSGFYDIPTLADSNSYNGTLPNKGMCLYYENGTNKIGGLQYKCPDKFTSALSPTTINCYAIKNFIWSAFHRKGSVADNPFHPETNKKACYAINPNSYIFVLRYVPIVNAEVSITRQDLRKFDMNSKMYKYPLYQQRNQADDYFCEAYKLGHKVWGELIRMSNTIYSVSDCFSDIAKIHNCGELYHINQKGRDVITGEGYHDENLYYINTVETEFTDSFIVQNITLSKDFNRISQYIGLDSSSRFYEVPEKYCDRYVKENAFFHIFTEFDELPSFIKADIGKDSSGKVTVTDYSDFSHAGKQMLLNYILKKDNHYPEIVEITFVDFGGGSKTVVLPISVLPIGSNLQFNFRCKDNFSAGTGYIGSPMFSGGAQFTNLNSSFKQYNQLTATGVTTPIVMCDTSNDNGNVQPYYFPICDSYCDIYGRVKSYKYSIGVKLKADGTIFTPNIRKDMQVLPLTEVVDFVGNKIGKSNLLDDSLKVITSRQKLVYKDAGERLLFSLCLNISTGSDRFSFSRYIWEANINANPSGTKIVALTKEINKFTESIITDDMVAKDGTGSKIMCSNASSLVNLEQGRINISGWIGHLTDEEINQVQSIAIMSAETKSTDPDKPNTYLYGKPMLYKNLGNVKEIVKEGAVISAKQIKTTDWLFAFSN